MLVQDAGDLKDKCFLQSTEVALTMTTTVSVVQQVNTEHEKKTLHVFGGHHSQQRKTLH